MRDLKFRVWDKIKKEMVDEFEYCSFAVELANGRLCSNWIDSLYVGGTIDSIGESRNSEDFIIMQFTGLKDRQGKEIYEGDICRFSVEGYNDIHTVQYGGPYNDAAFGITRIRRPGEGGPDPTWDPINPRYAERMEIIGNIYETPELIKAVP